MTTVDDFADCRNCRCLAARKAAQRLTRAYDAWVQPYGLTVHQFSMLAALIVGGPLPMSALADQLGVDRTTLTRNTKLTEQRGLVVVKPGHDARERVVHITTSGRKAAEAALPAWRAAQSESARD